MIQNELDPFDRLSTLSYELFAKVLLDSIRAGRSSESM
jgi:hypothetical protein